MNWYPAAAKYFIYVVVVLLGLSSANAQYEDREISRFHDFGGGLRVGVGDDNTDHPDTVYVQLFAWNAPLDETATNETITRGECTIRFDSDKQELHITHKSGKQWIARIRKLETYGRADVPGIEVAWRATDYEALYGLGERFDALNVAGRKIGMWIVDEPGQGDGSASYFVTPVIYSSAGYGFFAFNNPEGDFDLNSNGDGWHRYRFTGNSIYFWVTFGPDVPSMIQSRYDVMFGDNLVGRDPAPDWAYAPWISKNSYETQAEAEAVMDKMQALRLPFGVIVLEAWKGPSETGEFNRFDRARWPDVEGFFARCKRENVKVVLWQVPILHPSSPWFAQAKEQGFLVLDPEGNVSLREEWLAGFANIDFTNDRAIEFYKQMMRPVVELGVAGFKADDGEAIKPTDVMSNGRRGWDGHNLYSTVYNQATYQLVGSDGMIWARSGSTHIEESPGLWAGDQGAEWSQMRRLIPAGLSTGISGMPFWGHDIGGYYGHCTPELYIRWLQFGALSPFMQFHGIEPREPWHFGEEAIVAYRKLAALRATIRPLLEDLGREAARTGMPIMRPMFFVTGKHDGAAVPDQYMLGSDMLVAPVMREGATGRIVHFPDGQWRHALSAMVFEGPGEYSVPIGMVDAPLFVRVGSAAQQVVFADAQSSELPMVRNVQAPLRGLPQGDPVLLRFRKSVATGSTYKARWYFADAPGDVYDASLKMSPAGQAWVDLTPSDVAAAVGRRQVYELYIEQDSQDSLLTRGEISWHDLIRVEVDDPYLRVETKGGRITGRVTNATAKGCRVNMDLSLPREMMTKHAGGGVFWLEPGECRDFEFLVPFAVSEGYVGDVRAEILARSNGITYGRAEAALIVSPTWLVAGPFPASSKAQAFAATAAAEWSFGPKSQFKTPVGLLRWEAVDPEQVAEMDGLDFNALFGQQTNAYAYATALIHSDRDQPVQLRLGTDDTLSLWVNGEMLIAQSYDRAAQPDQDIIDTTFKKGVNRLLIKVAQGEYGWAMVARITDPQGNPVAGLTDALADASAYSKDRPEQGEVANVGFSLDWRCIGPFAYNAKQDVNGQSIIEDAIVNQQPLPDRVAGMMWQPLVADQSLGWYDLKQLSQDHHIMAYCTTSFDLDSPTEIELRCGSDDGLVLWVDGECVIDAENPRAFTPDEDVARVKLGKGKHRIVARVSQGTGEWGFNVRLWNVSHVPAIPLGAEN